MISLVFGIAFFVGIHLGISGTQLRDRLVARLGEGPYQGLFSLASALGLAWAIAAYARAPYVATWGAVGGGRWLAIALMAVAFFFFVVGLLTPGPTGPNASSLARGEPPRGVLRITRHPFLWGAALWSAVHLIWNGDLASLVFFGGFLVLTLSGPPSIDAKRARRHGADWTRFAAASSNVPFAAALAGRSRLGVEVFGEIGAWRLALWAVAFAGALFGHASVFGVSPFPP